MALPAGWDRCDPITLRFVDPGLERLYQHADEIEGIRRIRTAGLTAAVAWVLVAIIGPPALNIAPGSTWAISAFMVVFLIGTAVISGRATTQRRRDAIGLGQQLVAGVAVLALTLVTGSVGTYAMPAVMLTAVFGFAVTRHPFVGSIAIGVAYFALFLVVAVAAGVRQQLPLQLVIVGTTIVAACTGAYQLERSQRVTFAQGRLVAALHERVDRLLREYLSPDVAGTLIEDPARAELGGMDVEVSVLFADLRGYTSYSEGATPGDVVALLNTAYSVAVPAVLAEGGTVVQFLGDALMAIFNAPKPQPDHALRAARAALAMQRAVGELPNPDGRPRFRVGLNSGVALVGNIGSAEVRNFSAVGDTINLAARLQTFADEGSVVIGANTYDLIRPRAIVRPLGTPELKGKSRPVEVYELLGLRDDADSAAVGTAEAGASS